MRGLVLLISPFQILVTAMPGDTTKFVRIHTHTQDKGTLWPNLHWTTEIAFSQETPAVFFNYDCLLASDA